MLQHVCRLIYCHVFKHVGWFCCWCSLEQGSGSVLQQRQQLQQAGGGPSCAAPVRGVEYEYSPKWRYVTTNNRTSAGPVLDPHSTSSASHPSLQQPHWTTLIYSSKPKISRCFHSDILHVIKSGVGEHFLLKHAAHPAPQQAFVPLLIQIRQLRVTGCEAVGPSLACQSRRVCAVSRGALEPYCASSPSLPFFIFLRRGNMATPAAVNPSGKSVLGVLLCWKLSVWMLIWKR